MKKKTQYFVFPCSPLIFYPHLTLNLSRKEGSLWENLQHTCHVRLLKENEMSLICRTQPCCQIKGLPHSCAVAKDSSPHPF